MSPDKFKTYPEIISQTEAWAQALEITSNLQLPRIENYNQVIFTGCGSTYYLSLAAAALFQELTGFPARAVPAGELLLNPKTIISNPNNLLIALSRSGTTTETVRAVEKFTAGKLGDVLVISNYDALLSKLGTFRIVIPKGQEESVAQTRAFTSMYVAAAAFASRMANRNDLLEQMSSLPGLGDRLIQEFEPFARQIGENLGFDRFYFLGSGIHYGLACELNLKMKEMTLTHSEPFHFLEFRHGPMSMITDTAVVVGLISESNYKYEKAVIDQMQDLGARVITLGEAGVEIPFSSNILEYVKGVLYLPIMQLMAFYRSLAKGCNPDRPHNLEAVVKLNL